MTAATTTFRAPAARRGRRRPSLVFGACLVVASAVFLTTSSGVSAEAPTTLERAEAALADARRNANSLESRLLQREAELVAAEQSFEVLAGQNQNLADRLVSTEAQVREYVVNSYVNGGEPSAVALATNADDFAEMSWRDEVLQAAAQERRGDIALLAELRAAVGVQQAGAASQLESLQAEMTDLRNDLIQATAHEREAEDSLERVRRQEALKEAAEQQARQQAERQRALREAGNAASGSSGAPSAPVPAPGTTGIAGDPTAQELAMLAKIRRCESRGNYSIVSASGKYRGAYQFDRRTWAGVGGSGDPAAAPPYEQDYRALMLYRSRGGRPWPNCS